VLKLTGHVLLIALLTAATQIGGLAYLAALLLRRILFGDATKPAPTLLLLFLLCYGAGSTAVTVAAPHFGRVPLPCWKGETAPLAAASPLTCALNRHYVSPDLKHLAEALAYAVDREFPGSLTQVLDANFPFFDGFPLLPHLSHDDGRKLDLAFYYRPREGIYERGAMASPLGYWAFEVPGPGDPQPCVGDDRRLTLRWDMGWFQPFVRPDLTLDDARSKAALKWLATEGRQRGVERVLLEPHLKSRLSLDSDLVRFQGCRAARHDDHIHVQIR
jgi:hypothetical protein